MRMKTAYVASDPRKAAVSVGNIGDVIEDDKRAARGTVDAHS
jgi:hypothetical protein